MRGSYFGARGTAERHIFAKTSWRAWEQDGGGGGGSDIIEGKCYVGTFTALKGECFDGVIWGVTAVFTSVFCLYDKGICCCLNKTYCSYDQESVVVPQK